MVREMTTKLSLKITDFQITNEITQQYKQTGSDNEENLHNPDQVGGKQPMEPSM